MNHWPFILIVDDSCADAQSLSDMLSLEYRIELAHSGADALDRVQRSPTPDLVLLDIVMPGLDGFEVCKQLKQSTVTRDIPVVFVTAMQDSAQETRALELQAADYITKPYSIDVARARIRNALWSKSKPVTKQHNGDSSGGTSTSDGQIDGVLQTPTEPLPRLGKREVEVMALIADGMTSAEIAAQLFIAKGTVEVHRENIMRKLGVHNIAALVKYAVRNGMLAP
jgi:DNA-binding NarL/FixJ family response regulator